MITNLNIFSYLCSKFSYFFALSVTYNLMVILYLPSSNIGQKVRNGSRTDLTKCKLTQLGMEYRGGVSKTAGNIRCQSWYSEEPIHEINAEISDKDFPERSMKVVKNYCRNPTGDVRGPWCYTMDPSLIDDECDVPLCNFGGCRLSGPGAEYGGNKDVTISGSKCKSWHKRYQLPGTKSPKFEDDDFPDKSRKKADNFCRNPSGDLGGPWCYVDDENFDYVQKQYCDIPFCDDKDCLTLAKNVSGYSIVTKLYEDTGNVSFSIKLWNPDNEKLGRASLLLGLLPFPVSAETMAEEWTAGVELIFANSGSGQTFPKFEDEEILENTPEILLGTKWTGIWITWGGGFISAGIDGSTKPLIMQEYKKKHGITSLHPDTFLYYGFSGTNVLWNNPFCHNHCERHTTFGIDFSKSWAMQKNNDSIDVRFFVRASLNVQVRLYQTPSLEYPSVTVIIGKDITTLIYQEAEDSSKQYLKEISTSGLLDFWSWREFSISIFGGHFRLFTQKARGAIELLYMNENFFGTLRWFSIGSEKTVAHWTLYCQPEESDAVEDPWMPNCISDLKDFQYKGSQWTSINEIPCIPWISEKVPEEERIDEKFIDGSVLKALNYCRNPSQDTNGPYCYGYTPWESEIISKKYCPIRSCRSLECRMAGTANDYVGTLSRTRSGRTCDKWPTGPAVKPTTSAPGTSAATPRRTRVKGPKSKQHHGEMNLFVAAKTTTAMPRAAGVPKVGPTFVREYFNESFYPERNAKNASNYCRNPSRNMAGTWCYTNDPNVPQDLCNVRDCEKPEEFTFLAKGDGTGRRLYILPEYRSDGLHFSVKAWEPDDPDSITFAFLADDGLKSRYLLKIGTADNERVLLFYESESEPISLVKKKTLPHLLYVGKWSNFIVRIPRGKIFLFYEDDPTPLFEWSHPDPPNAFLPMYYYYSTEQSKTVGLAFDRDSSCHVENTKTDRYTRFLSLGTWTQKEVEQPEQLMLQIRGKGGISIPLYIMPAMPGFFELKLNDPDRWISFGINSYPSVKVFHKQRSQIPLFTTNSWTNVTIRWSGSTMDIYSNSTNVFNYEHIVPLVFYFFSVGVTADSWATWSANCLPTDIDGPPMDGGWSEWGPWACSVSCNGGTGVRKRKCDSPKPNVRGEPCVGPNAMTGRCNEILCGDITEDTVILINRRIRTNHTALSVLEGKSIVVESDSDIVTLITEESPRSELQWSLNGVFVVEEADRIKLKDDNIEITKAVLNDSGVYAMTLRRIDGTYSIIKVISLAVIPTETSLRVRETLATTIRCHCTVLGHTYSELQIAWTLRDKTWKDYGIALPMAADIEHLRKVNRSHDGLWKCVVKQNDLSFQWITNMIYVKVLAPPDWRTYLMEDQATRFFFGWLPNEDYAGVFALVLFLIIVCGIIAGSYQYIKFRESTRTLFDLKRPVKSPKSTQYSSLSNEEQGDE